MKIRSRANPEFPLHERKTFFRPVPHSYSLQWLAAAAHWVTGPLAATCNMTCSTSAWQPDSDCRHCNRDRRPATIQITRALTNTEHCAVSPTQDSRRGLRVGIWVRVDSPSTLAKRATGKLKTPSLAIMIRNLKVWLQSQAWERSGGPSRQTSLNRSSSVTSASHSSIHPDLDWLTETRDWNTARNTSN